MILFKFLLVLFIILSGISYTSADTTATELYLPDTSVFKIDKENPVFTLWVASDKAEAKNVTINIPFLISESNEKISINYKVFPESLNITQSSAGALFRITLDSSAINDLKPGIYSAVLLINSDNAPMIKENIKVELLPTGFEFSEVINGVDWVWSNILTFLWKLIEILVFLFLLYLLIRWIVKQIVQEKKPIRILPIANETGDESKYGGVASGIDDILISHMQQISELMEKSDEKNVKKESEFSGKRERNLSEQEGKSQSFNIARSNFSMDFHKIGDISIGPVKIPIGSMISFFSKMLGGGYLTGALQQYGSNNKLILTLEEKPTFFSGSYLTVFEATWPSESNKESDLAEGIPGIVEELSYKIVLELSNIKTDSWKAFKHYLKGNLFYSSFEKNTSRKDLLRDAIDCWRESLRFDSEFADVQYNLGVALDKENKIEDALFRYKRAYDFGNEEMKANAYLNSAVIYREMKDLSETQKRLDIVKKLKPKLSAAHNLQGLIYLDQSNLNYNLAEKCFKEAIDLDREEIKKENKKPNAIYYYNLSIAQYYLLKYDEAEKNALFSYKLYEDNFKPTGLLQTLGIIYMQKGFLLEDVKENIQDQKAETEFKKAGKYFEEGLKNEPEKNFDIIDGYAQALFHLGDKETAALYYKRLVRVWPEYYRGHEGLIKIIPNDNLYKIWLEKVKKILTNYPDNREKLLQLEDLLNTNLGEPVAVKLISAVIGGINFYNLAEYNSAAKHFYNSVIIKLDFIFEAEVYNTYGLVLFESGKYEQAILQFQNAILKYDKRQVYDIARCYENLAKAYSYLNVDEDDNYNKTWEAFSNAIDFYKKSDLINNASEMHVEKAKWLNYNRYYEGAEKECKEAILLNSNNLNVYHIKGNTLYNRRRYSEAIPQYEHSVELNYDTPGTHYTMGLCYLYLENYEEALIKFITSLKLDDRYGYPYDFKSPDAFQRIAFCYEKLGENDKAIEILRNAVNLFPRKVKYNILLARALKKANKYEEAAEELCFALTDDEKNEQNFKHLVLNELADIYSDYGADSAEAFKLINEAVKICRQKERKISKEEFCSIKNTLGWIYFKRKEYKKAAIYLEKTLTSFLDNPQMHMRLALIYEKLAENNENLLVKTEYKNKAKDQWQRVSNLSTSNGLSKAAEEHLKIIN